MHGDAEKFRKDDLELLQTHKRIDMQETYLSANGEARIVQTLKALVPMEGRKPLLIGISWELRTDACLCNSDAKVIRLMTMVLLTILNKQSNPI